MRPAAAERASSAALTPARRVAFRVLRRVSSASAYADQAFRGEADRAGLEGRDRAFAQTLAFGAIQRSATLDYLIAAIASRPLERIEPPLLDALRLGVYQLVFAGGVADYAAVEQTVELAGRERPPGRGFANAVMRRAAREARALLAELDDTTPGGAALLHSHPPWLVRMWWDELGGEAARALLARDNEPSETAVRVNTLRANPSDVAARLAEQGVDARSAPRIAEGLVLDSPYDLGGSPLFAGGAITPQSRASMLVGHVVAPMPGERVLDLCAAPGAKTSHLAALMRGEGSIVAVELHRGRTAALEANLRRLGAASVEVVTADATVPLGRASFDRVLLDAPCSGLGTLQRHPDARWRKRPVDVERLERTQSALLAAAAAQVRPGGALIYSTCTISYGENERQIERFLATHADFAAEQLGAEYPGLESARGGRFLQLLPHRDMTDGFFIARLRRSA